MDVLRCISFVTVSSEEQAGADRNSLDTQRAWTTAFIRDTLPLRYGVRGVEVRRLEIIGSRKILLLSDAIQAHDAYRDLVQAIEDRDFDILVAMKMNRVAREEALAITLRDLCLRQGIVPAWGDGLPPTLDINVLRADEGWRISGMVQAWGAGREVRELAQKVRDGRRGRALERGLFSSKTNYGYTHVRDENDEKVYIVDARTAPVIRQVFVDWYLGQGWGAPRIADELNRRKIPSQMGTRWNVTVVTELLGRARLYGGEVVHGGVWATGKHPAILTADEVAAVERERQQRGKGRPRTYAYSGTVVCDQCGRRMAGDSTAQGRRYYRCRHCKVYVDEDDIADALTRMVDYLETVDVSDMALPDVADNYEHRLRAVDAQMAAAQAAMSKLVDAYELGTIPLDLLSSRIEDRKDELANLKAARERIVDEAQRRADAGTAEERIDEIKASARSMLTADPDVARPWWREFFEVRIVDRDTIEVHPRLFIG